MALRNVYGRSAAACAVVSIGAALLWIPLGTYAHNPQSLSIGAARVSAETPEQRCQRETQAYNATWRRQWESTHPDEVALGKSAPPPPVPYRCVSGPSVTPTPLPGSGSQLSAGAGNVPQPGAVDPVTGLPEGVGPAPTSSPLATAPYNTPGRPGYNPANPWVSRPAGRAVQPTEPTGRTTSQPTPRVSDGTTTQPEMREQDVPLNHRLSDGTPEPGYRPYELQPGDDAVPLNKRDANGHPLRRRPALPTREELLDRFLPRPDRASQTDTSPSGDDSAVLEDVPDRGQSAQRDVDGSRRDSWPVLPGVAVVASAGLLTGLRRRRWQVFTTQSDTSSGRSDRQEKFARQRHGALAEQRKKYHYDPDEVRKVNRTYEKKADPWHMKAGTRKEYSTADGRKVIVERHDKYFTVEQFAPNGKLLYRTWQWSDDEGNYRRKELNVLEGRITDSTKGPRYVGGGSRTVTPVWVDKNNEVHYPPTNSSTQGSSSNSSLKHAWDDDGNWVAVSSGLESTVTPYRQTDTLESPGPSLTTLQRRFIDMWAASNLRSLTGGTRFSLTHPPFLKWSQIRVARKRFINRPVTVFVIWQI